MNEVFKFPECKCFNDTKDQVVSAECEFSQTRTDAGMVVFENICDVKRRMKNVKRSADDEQVSLAVESKTSKEGLTLEDIFNTVDRSRDNVMVNTFYILDNFTCMYWFKISLSTYYLHIISFNVYECSLAFRSHRYRILGLDDLI